MLARQSILGTGVGKAEISCNNHVISQTVTVKITEDIFDFGILSIFGIETPKAVAEAKANVSDCDELVRNTDFICDMINTISSKLGIDIKGMRQKVNDLLAKVGIVT